MEKALKHAVIGFAVGACAALLMVGLGTVLLLLGLVPGLWHLDTVLWFGVTSGWCYHAAPIVGTFAFSFGILASLSLAQGRKSRR